jgi:hypothetical protein
VKATVCRVLFAGLLVATTTVVPQKGGQVIAATCAAGNLSAAQLTTAFSRPGLGATPGHPGYAGGDYQHVYALPNGSRLWLFQDMFFSNDNDLRDSLTMAAHNAGLLQRGNCWKQVGGPQMHNYVGSSLTTPLTRWFWPMGGDIGADGYLWIFFVEMRNPSGTGAAWGSAPAATWIARINPSTLAVASFTKARNAGTRLYGWSVTSDDTYSYLYGHCYRQYIHRVSGAGQFDATCMPSSYLARVPKGHFTAAPTYWTGSGWSSNPASARPVMTRGHANPMDVRRFGKVFVNVTKIDDWWGAKVYVDRAAHPWGPWTNVRAIDIVNSRRCSQCGIYHAQAMPYLVSGRLVISWSNGGAFNLWQANASLYRPSFVSVALPA